MRECEIPVKNPHASVCFTAAVLRTGDCADTSPEPCQGLEYVVGLRDQFRATGLCPEIPENQVQQVCQHLDAAAQWCHS